MILLMWLANWRRCFCLVIGIYNKMQHMLGAQASLVVHVMCFMFWNAHAKTWHTQYMDGQDFLQVGLTNKSCKMLCINVFCVVDSVVGFCVSKITNPLPLKSHLNCCT